MMVQHVAVRDLADGADPIEKPAGHFRSTLATMNASAGGAHHSKLRLTADGEIQDRSGVGSFSLILHAKEGREEKKFLQPGGLEPEWKSMKKARDCRLRGPIQHYRHLIGSEVGPCERGKSERPVAICQRDYLLLVGAEGR